MTWYFEWIDSDFNLAKLIGRLTLDAIIFLLGLAAYKELKGKRLVSLDNPHNLLIIITMIVMIIKLNVINLILFSFVREMQIVLTIMAIFSATIHVITSTKTPDQGKKYKILLVFVSLIIIGFYILIVIICLAPPEGLSCGVDLKSLHFLIYGFALFLVGVEMALSDTMMIEMMNYSKVRKNQFLNQKKRTVDLSAEGALLFAFAVLRVHDHGADLRNDPVRPVLHVLE